MTVKYILLVLVWSYVIYAYVSKYKETKMKSDLSVAFSALMVIVMNSPLKLSHTVNNIILCTTLVIFFGSLYIDYKDKKK